MAFSGEHGHAEGIIQKGQKQLVIGHSYKLLPYLLKNLGDSKHYAPLNIMRLWRFQLTVRFSKIYNKILKKGTACGYPTQYKVKISPELLTHSVNWGIKPPPLFHPNPFPLKSVICPSPPLTIPPYRLVFREPTPS